VMFVLVLALQMFTPVDVENFARLHAERVERAEAAGDALALRTARRDLGRFWLEQGRPAEAVAWLQLAGDTLPLAQALDRVGRREEARAEFLKAAEFADGAAAAKALTWLAEDAERTEDWKQAVALHRRALGREATVTRRVNLAIALQSAGQLQEAEPIFRTILAEQRRKYGPNHPEVATAGFNLATLLADTGRKAEALALLRESVRVFTATLGAEHPRTRLARETLAASR
jgi:tetratricopeptide (TPR) repeat protein